MQRFQTLLSIFDLRCYDKDGDELKRSEDYGEIVSKLSFPAPPTASSDGGVQSAATVTDAFAAVRLGTWPSFKGSKILTTISPPT
jgi:hypothetical protein